MYIYSHIHLRFTMYSIVCLSVTLCIGFTEYGLTAMHRIYGIRTDGNSFTNRYYQLQLSHKPSGQIMMTMLFEGIPSTEPFEDIPSVEASEGIYLTNIYLFIVCKVVSLFCLFSINLA